MAPTIAPPLFASVPAASYSIPPGVQDESRRTITNAVTGEKVYFAKYGYETGGQYTEAIITCKSGGGPPLHYHFTYAERFEGIEGQLEVQLNDEQPRSVKAGEIVDIPVKTPHRFSAGEKGAKFKGLVLPADAGFEQSLYILFGLAQDGELGNDGLPRSLIHTAVVGSLGGMSFPGASGAVLNVMTSALAAYARWSGVQDALIRKYWAQSLI